ncbi:MAG: peptidylprolyl isomerase [Alphaproteobacteria bacterium]|nr:peptidylprolyl isomerase [Alphaproteobacteria bacterium]
MYARRSVSSFRFSMLAGAAAIAALAVVGQQSAAIGATKEPVSMRAAAIVNDAIISTYDLDQRIKLVMVTSGAQGADAIKRLRPQVLRQLVDETLQLQEAIKFNVKITQEDLDKNFKRIASQNNIGVDAIYKMLDENGIARNTLQNQIKADLAWQKLVQQRLSPRVTVSDDEVDEIFKQLQASAKQTQYAVSEIFLAVDTPEAEEATRQNIQSILGQLRGGANFSAIARQFSQAPSASNGGDLGAISESDMQPAIAAAVTKMQPGGVSDPIRGPGGYYIMGLREKRLPSGSKVEAQPKAAPAAPQAAQKMKTIIEIAQVVIPMAQGASKAKQEAVRAKSIEIYRSINGCASAPQIAKAHGARFQRFGSMNTKEMAPQFVKILSGTPNGRSTPPLVGSQGVEMYIICSGGMVPAPGAMPEGAQRPTVTAQSDVTKEEVESRLYNQELSMLARRYLRDLRRDATIEMRDN